MKSLSPSRKAGLRRPSPIEVLATPEIRLALLAAAVAAAAIAVRLAGC